MNSAHTDHAQGADPVVVIGAGPAGLTAALELVERGRSVTVLEADSVVGGISRTVVADGWRFDIGGHRFFTKVPSVKERWHKILDDDDFLTRSRLSRIFYNRKFFDYPLKAANALRNLGIVEAVRAVSSYLWARIRPPKDQSTFEGFVSARFGRRLYSIFFESYTQKVWGIHPSVMPADWAAQRIKNLSLGRAVLDALLPRRGGRTDVTSLIEEFLYPRLGPGMMWDRAAEQVTDRGGTIVMHATAEVIRHDAGKVTEIVVRTAEGEMTMPASGGVISSMPLGHLVNALEPAPPPMFSRPPRPSPIATSSPLQSRSPRTQPSPTTGSTSTSRRSRSGVSRTSGRGHPTWSSPAPPASAWSTSSRRGIGSGRRRRRSDRDGAP